MDNRDNKLNEFQNRRQFLESLPLFAAGISAVTGCSQTSQISNSKNPPSPKPLVKSEISSVEFRHGNDRYKTISDSLEPLRETVAEQIGNKRVIIKVNCALIEEKLRINSTYPDHIRAILDFLKPIHDQQILISEGTASMASSIMPAYKNYGYLPLEKEYNIKFIDANDQPTKELTIHTLKRDKTPIKVNYSYMDPNIYLISAALVKTHNNVVATLSAKNVIMGSPQCRYWEKGKNISDKPLMHGWSLDVNSGKELSHNLYTLALAGIRPDLAVIDGTQGIEGNGPWGGEIVEHGIAISSTDFIAADRIGFELMGIDPYYMKYLEWCGNAGIGNFDLSKITVSGPDYKNYIRKYKLNENFSKQVDWIEREYKRG